MTLDVIYHIIALRLTEIYYHHGVKNIEIISCTGRL